MARSVSSRSAGPGEVSRATKTKWKRSSVKTQAAANRKKARRLNTRKSKNYK